MVNKIDNHRSDHYLSGVKGYQGLNNASSREDGSSDLSSDSRIDDAKDNIAALRESIMGSREMLGVNRTNSVTHDFDDFDKSFL